MRKQEGRRKEEKDHLVLRPAEGHVVCAYQYGTTEDIARNFQSEDILGLSWARRGTVLGCPGLSWAVLGCPGPVLSCPAPVVGLSWAILEPSRAVLGLCEAILGTSRGRLGTFWGPYWPVLGSLGGNLGGVEWVWAHLWPKINPRQLKIGRREPKRAPSEPKRA